jgi:hypothetical protein
MDEAQVEEWKGLPQAPNHRGCGNPEEPGIQGQKQGRTGCPSIPETLNQAHLKAEAEAALGVLLKKFCFFNFYVVLMNFL